MNSYKDFEMLDSSLDDWLYSHDSEIKRRVTPSVASAFTTSDAVPEDTHLNTKTHTHTHENKNTL